MYPLSWGCMFVFFCFNLSNLDYHDNLFYMCILIIYIDRPIDNFSNSQQQIFHLVPARGLGEHCYEKIRHIQMGYDLEKMSNSTLGLDIAYQFESIESTPLAYSRATLQFGKEITTRVFISKADDQSTNNDISFLKPLFNSFRCICCKSELL